MAVNANIFAQYLKPPKSVQEYGADMDAADLSRLQLEAQKRQNVIAELTQQQKMREQEEMGQDRKVLQRLALETGGDPMKLAQGLRASGRAGLLPQADTMEAGYLKRRETESKIAKEQSETADAAVKRYRGALDYIDTKAGAARWLAAQYQDPALSEFMQRIGPLEAGIARIPDDPAQLQQWRERTAIGMEKFKEIQQRMAQAAQSDATTRRGQNLTDSRARELNEITREAQQSQVIIDPERGPIIVNKGRKTATVATMDGQPVQGEAPAKRAAASKRTLPIIDQAEKLIDSATGSYAGAAVDSAARVAGVATDGAESIARLRVLEGSLMMAQPRMEGPQSNLDVDLYRQMAGQIGDPTVPRSTKKAALKTIRELHEKYAGSAQPVTDFVGRGAAASPAVGGFSDAEKERRYQEWKAKQK